MLNSAWPEMYWQLYDSYLMPNGAFYGAKKASQPYHAIYDYAKHSIFVVNDKLEARNEMVLKVRAFDKASNLKYEEEVKANLAGNTAVEIIKLPEMDWGKPVYFLDLRLYDSEGMEIDNNFYWLSEKKDILDYDAEIPSWYYHTPSKQYADFNALNKLPKVEIEYSAIENKGDESTGFLVELKNNSNKIAFFIHPRIVDKQSGNSILPVIWSDNYVSLLPGESRKLTATIKNKYLKNKYPGLVVEGFNLIEE
jgi:exo-1,4-beta-D-glucosaminidase